MSDLIERDKIYEAVYDLACKSAGVIGGIGEDYACGLREAAHMIEEAPAVEAVPAVRGCHCRARSVFEATGNTETVVAAQVGHVRWRQEDAYTWVCTACGHKQIFFEGGPLKMIVALIAGWRSASTKNYRIPAIFVAMWKRKREEA